MITGIRIDDDGTLTVTTLDNSTPAATAASIRTQLGCDRFDVVRLPEAVDMWVDEEAVYRANVNPVASAIARLHEAAAYVFGPVLLLGVDYPTGQSTSITAEQTAQIVLWWRFVTTPSAHA
jgi:Domain of unknown function (DUF3846)